MTDPAAARTRLAGADAPRLTWAPRRRRFTTPERTCHDAGVPGREFTVTVRAGLADSAPSGRVRLDAIARWLQDVAYADIEAQGLHELALWVLRRTRLRVVRFPRFAERLELRTSPAGLGRMWGERRTTVADPRRPDEPLVEATALWVHLDPRSLRPIPFAPEELAAYAAAAPVAPAARRITARLRHPAPGDGAVEVGRWLFRATDLDLADHVNNAAYWQPLEAELIAGAEPASLDAEIEFRRPSQPGAQRILADGPMRWLVPPGEEPTASVRLTELAAPGRRVAQSSQPVARR